MQEVKLYLPGKPIAWARPGQSAHGRYDTQRRAKDALGLIIHNQLGIHQPLEGKIHLEAMFYMPEPKSLKASESGGYHSKKPDIDNLLKFYLDVCKDFHVFHDDAQVSKVEMAKVYGGTRLGVVLTFEEIP